MIERTDAETNEPLSLEDDSKQASKFDLLIAKRKTLQKNERTSSPIVKSFLEKGPLTPMYHKHWDKLSDTVIFPSKSSSTVEVTEYADSHGTDDDLRSISSSLDSLFSIYQESSSTLQSRSTFNESTCNNHWNDLENIFYRQIYNFVLSMERNKFLTHQTPFTEMELEDQKANCRTLAKARIKLLHQIITALTEEDVKESRRQRDEHLAYSKVALKRLKAYHEEDRRQSRLYLHRLQEEGNRILLERYYEFGLG